MWSGQVARANVWPCTGIGGEASWQNDALLDIQEKLLVSLEDF